MQPENNNEENRPDTRIQFFGDLSVLQKLLERKFDPSSFEETELWFDLIDLPFAFRYAADPEQVIMEIFKRSEMGVLDEHSPEASLTFTRADGNAAVKTTAALKDNMMPFFAACANLAKYAAENDLLTPVDKNSGILLKAGAFKITSAAVSGKKRPDLMVEALFGGSHMGRPYMDEFMENSMNDLLGIGDDDDDLQEEYNELMSGDDDTEPDYEAAAELLREKAEEGSAIAMYNLGLHYWKGCGVEQDYDRAIEWMEQAAEAGDEDAPGIIEELKKAKESKKQADAGDAQAQADYARHLMRRAGSFELFGPGKDYEECVEYAKKAAAQRNPDGMYVLALAYQHGRGVEEDCEKAVKLYARAAAMGHAPSMTNLGCCYGNGEGIEENQELAMEWVRKAAELNDPDALRILGKNPEDDDAEEEAEAEDFLNELREGVEEGNEDAIRAYAAACLMNSKRLDDTTEHAVQMLDELADKGDAESLKILAAHYSELAAKDDVMDPAMMHKAVRYYARLGDELFEDDELAADFGKCFSWMPDLKNPLDGELARFWYKVSTDLGNENSSGMYKLLSYAMDHMAEQGYDSQAEFLEHAFANNMLDEILAAEGPEYEPVREEFERLYAAYGEKYFD